MLFAKRIQPNSGGSGATWPDEFVATITLDVSSGFPAASIGAARPPSGEVLCNAPEEAIYSFYIVNYSVYVPDTAGFSLEAWVTSGAGMRSVLLKNASCEVNDIPVTVDGDMLPGDLIFSIPSSVPMGDADTFTLRLYNLEWPNLEPGEEIVT